MFRLFFNKRRSKQSASPSRPFQEGMTARRENCSSPGQYWIIENLFRRCFPSENKWRIRDSKRQTVCGSYDSNVIEFRSPSLRKKENHTKVRHCYLLTVWMRKKMTLVSQQCVNCLFQATAHFSGCFEMVFFIHPWGSLMRLFHWREAF